MWKEPEGRIKHLQGSGKKDEEKQERCCAESSNAPEGSRKEFNVRGKGSKGSGIQGRKGFWERNKRLERLKRV